MVQGDASYLGAIGGKRGAEMKLGICRVCHDKIQINQVSGMLRKHFDKFMKQPCAGAGRRPCDLERLKNEQR